MLEKKKNIIRQIAISIKSALFYGCLSCYRFQSISSYISCTSIVISVYLVLCLNPIPSAGEIFVRVVDYQPAIVSFAEVGNAAQLVRR